jgi:hypothetical protein
MLMHSFSLKMPTTMSMVPIILSMLRYKTLPVRSLTVLFKGDLCNAELYAQMKLDSLKDPRNGLDQQSEAVARGYYDLASVIKEQRGDMVEAEKLIRESPNQS